MEKRVKISALVQTYNAAETLETTLRSLTGFDELVVCDMHSQDDTIAICERHNARIVYHEWTRIVEPARNFAISQTSHEWVLVVDADEVVTPELREHLYQIAAAGNTDGVFIPRRNFFMGRFIRTSYPDYNLRFFRKQLIDWPPTIHSIPKLDGNVIYLPKKRAELALIHRNDPSMFCHLAKINTYSDKDALKRSRKKKNYSLFMTTLSALSRFFMMFIVRGGFRDGRAGFAYAGYAMFYKFIILTKLWEPQVRAKKDKNSIPEFDPTE